MRVGSLYSGIGGLDMSIDLAIRTLQRAGLMPCKVAR